MIKYDPEHHPNKLQGTKSANRRQRSFVSKQQSLTSANQALSVNSEDNLKFS